MDIRSIIRHWPVYNDFSNWPDGYYSGSTVSLQAGENLAQFEVAYMKAADGKMWKTDGNAEATTTGLVGMAMKAVGANLYEFFLLIGVIKNVAWAWTAQDELWVSGTAGAITAVPLAGSGDFRRKLGGAINGDVIYFQPDWTVAKVA